MMPALRGLAVAAHGSQRFDRLGGGRHHAHDDHRDRHQDLDQCEPRSASHCTLVPPALLTRTTRVFPDPSATVT